MKVFISWSGTDREVKNAIVARLRGLEVCGEPVECWESDGNCISDFSDECIRSIRSSSVVIVLISEASMSPESYVFNEVIEARRMEGEGKLNILVYKLTDAPYTPRFAMQLNHISDANHLSRIESFGTANGIDTIVKRTKYLLRCRFEGMPEMPNDVISPKVMGVEIPARGYFVPDSRKDVIDAVADGFHHSNVVILSGLFGFGKKSALREYVRRRRYSSAIEVQGFHESICRFLLNGLHFSNVNEEIFTGDERSIIRKKIDLLKKLDDKHILIVSDVDIEGEADEYAVGLLGELKCHVAFVTQNAADAYRDFFPVIPVGRMASEYLVELFFHYYDRNGTSDRLPLIPILERFFDEVGGHTKTVELAASVLSKEMRAAPEEMAQYLVAGADNQHTLHDGIVNKLSALIAMESFNEATQKALLIIALLAYPTLEDVQVYDLMAQCGVSDRRIITELDHRRWINYDSHNRSVHMEPIIADICVSRFLSDYEIPRICFAFIMQRYSNWGLQSVAGRRALLQRGERLLRVLGMNEGAELFFAMRMSLTGIEVDAEQVEACCDRYEAWYRVLLERCDGLSDREEFILMAASLLRMLCLPGLRMSVRAPLLYGVMGSHRVASEDMENIFEATFDAEDDLIERTMHYFSAEVFGGVFGEENRVTTFFSSLCDDLFLNSKSKNVTVLQRRMDAMVEYLQSRPALCEDPRHADAMLMAVGLFTRLCADAGAYQMGAIICERLLSVSLPSYHLHQILMDYVNLLLLMDAVEDATNAMEVAEEVFPEALSMASADERLHIRREHVLLLIFVQTRNGALDDAVAGCRTLVNSELKGVEITVLLAVNTVVDALLLAGRRTDAYDLVEQYRELIEDYEKRDDAEDGIKQICENLLAQSEFARMMADGRIATGGTVVSESYYRRYSTEKRNNLFAMMSYNRIADDVKRFDFSNCTDVELKAHTKRLRGRAAAGEDKKKLAPEAFALVSEAGFRTLGYRHHRTQYVGAAAMLDGKIAEILNGEGKTYTVALVAYVNTLYYAHTFVMDDSPYLTERNYKWMRGLYALLGVTVGHMAKRNKWYENDSSAQIVYTTLDTFGFDQLHREMSDVGKNRRDLSRCSVIVDEADSVLVELAKTPIQITALSRRGDDVVKDCDLAYRLAVRVKDDPRFCEIDGARIRLKRALYPLLEEAFGIGADRVEKMSKLERLVRKALYCISREKGKDFFLREGKTFEEDETTGRLLEVTGERGYFFARVTGLPTAPYVHALCSESKICNMTHVYGLMRSFGSLSGTSATVSSFKKEFKELYGLETVAIPTLYPVVRLDRTITLYTTRKVKDRDILQMIEEKHKKGQPVLLVVKNVRDSQYYATLLRAKGIPYKVLNAVNAEQSPELLSEAGLPSSVLVATKLANRGVDIRLGGDAERMTLMQLAAHGYDLSRLDEILYTVPTAEARQSELYRSYEAMLEKNRAVVTVNRERVLAAGGLCVISAEPHGDMRIEQQIRGRAGRQGAVGESYVFESVEDDFFRDYFANYDRLLRTMRPLDMDLIDLGLLKRVLNAAKVRIHHVTFQGMARASEISARVEGSKREVFRLLDGLRECSEQTLAELLQVWASDARVSAVAEYIVDETAEAPLDAQATRTMRIADIENSDIMSSDLFRMLPNGEPSNGIRAVLFLAQNCPAVFGSSVHMTVEKRLMTAANRQKDETRSDAFYDVLRGLLKQAFVDHLTDMNALENAYADQRIRNVKQILDKMYRADMKERLIDVVGRWLTYTAKGTKGSSMTY